MMSYKFFYLYIAGGTVALLWLIYRLIAYYPALNTLDLVINAVPAVLLYYLAYKVRREKENKDMM
jgi:membrane protein implicated in regulation of membrane protease activity